MGRTGRAYRDDTVSGTAANATYKPIMRVPGTNPDKKFRSKADPPEMFMVDDLVIWEDRPASSEGYSPRVLATRYNSLGPFRVIAVSGVPTDPLQPPFPTGHPQYITVRFPNGYISCFSGWWFTKVPQDVKSDVRASAPP